jgi:hypothetical protein
MPTKEQVAVAVDAVWMQYVSMVSTYGKEHVLKVLLDQWDEFPDQRPVIVELRAKIERAFP